MGAGQGKKKEKKRKIEESGLMFHCLNQCISVESVAWSSSLIAVAVA